MAGFIKEARYVRYIPSELLTSLEDDHEDCRERLIQEEVNREYSQLYKHVHRDKWTYRQTRRGHLPSHR